MRMRIFTKVSLYMTFLCGTGPALAQTTITANGGLLSVQYTNSTSKENYQTLTDNNVNTKYLARYNACWIRYESPQSAIVTQYSISSANDAAGRDPKNWTLEGSDNGTSWTVVDTRTNETFASRFLTKTYNVAGAVSYLYYRLNITANNGDAYTQLSEWKLTGTLSGPAKPGGLTGTALPGAKISLTWSDNATGETGYRIDQSVDGRTFFSIATLPANSTTFTDSLLSSSTVYVYRVRSFDSTGYSIPDTAANVTTVAAPGGVIDLTNFINTTVTDPYNTTGNEGLAKAVDNSAYTKYLAWANTTWVRVYLPAGGIATQYAITSANDAVERDPKNWLFQASHDGTNWTTLQTQTNQQFNARQKRRLYTVNNDSAYTYYRLNINGNNGGAITQLAELEIYGTGTGEVNTGAPAAPAALTATGVSSNNILLTWTDVAGDETAYRLERSTDSSNWDLSEELNISSSKFFSVNLLPLTTYYYRVRTENSNGNSAWVYAKATTQTDVAPLTWQEHWSGHDELLSLVYSNSSVNIYFDEAVDRSATWMNQTFTDVWEYVKQNYGSFSDPKVNMVFHSVSGYSGGHPATVFDAHHDYRNAGDLGGQWTDSTGWNLGASIHEIGHIVEIGGKGVLGSPAFGIWGDSKWAEIFIYDVCKRLGRTADAQQAYNDAINGHDAFPKPATYWFRDWFYPIYTRADSSAALNRFFDLVAEYFPKHNGEYTRGMNLGEFVHFWSGAAQYNLSAQADTAFGWTRDLEIQFKQAQIDFPFTYPDQLPVPLVAAVAEVKPAIRSIWPNPASHILNIILPDAETVYTVDVYSMNGVKRLSQRLKGGYSTLNISSLADGVYIVRVSNNKKVVFTQKTVVNNYSAVR